MQVMLKMIDISKNAQNHNLNQTSYFKSPHIIDSKKQKKKQKKTTIFDMGFFGFSRHNL
jgi:hypothetical protein